MKPQSRDTDRARPRRRWTAVVATALLLILASGGVAYAQYAVAGQGSTVVTVVEPFPTQCPPDTHTTTYVCAGDPDWTATGGEVTFQGGHVVVPAGTSYTGSVPQFGLTVRQLMDIEIILTDTGSPQTVMLQFEVYHPNGLPNQNATVTMTWPPTTDGSLSADDATITATDQAGAEWIGGWLQFQQEYGDYALSSGFTVTATDTDLSVDEISFSATTPNGLSAYTVDFMAGVPA